MPDNSTQQGNDTIATDDITTLNGGAVSGVKAQRVKVGYGSDASLRDVDAANGLPVAAGQGSTSSTSWTSATSVNTANSISIANFSTVSVAVISTTTITGGVLSFEVSPDGTNWLPIAMARIDSYTVETTYTLVASSGRGWTASVDAFTNFRVRLSTAITGTATVAVFVIGQAMAIEPVVTVGQSNAANLNATVAVAQGGNTAAVRQVTSGGAGLAIIGTQQPNTTGSITTATTTITTGDLSLANVIGVTVYGTYAGVNITFEASWDNTNWSAINGQRIDTGEAQSVTGVLPANTIRQWSFTFAGSVYFRARATAWTSGSASVAIDPGTLPMSPFVSNAINPSITGGWLTNQVISAATTNATSVKASSGQVGGWYLSNINAAARYLKLYDLAVAPTVGTSTAKMTIAIPGGGAAGAGANIEFTQGIAFTTGVALALTTGVANTDTGAVAANEIVVNLMYR